MPGRFFKDLAQCNLQGAASPTAGLPDCPQGISAVKALGIAAAQGQKIYTITQSVFANNPNIVNTALSAHSYDTKSRVQRSLYAGNEVTIYERPITESGWTGAGYIAIDPKTGAGAYTIDGGSNGGLYVFVGLIFLGLAIATLVASGGLAGAVASGIVAQEILLGLGYILMGIGKIIDNQDLVNGDALVALGGVAGLSLGLALISKAFAFVANGVFVAVVAALQSVVSSVFPK